MEPMLQLMKPMDPSAPLQTFTASRIFRLGTHPSFGDFIQLCCSSVSRSTYEFLICFAVFPRLGQARLGLAQAWCSREWVPPLCFQMGGLPLS